MMAGQASNSSIEDNSDQDVVIHFGRDEIIIRQRYEFVSILNDILIGLWFVVGSIFFFFDTLTFAGTWCFVAGSTELLIRPAIRLTRQIHLQRRFATPPSLNAAGHDF